MCSKVVALYIGAELVYLHHLTNTPPHMKRLLIAALFLSSCSYSNVDAVKENAERTFAENGFQVIGCHGYELGPVVPFTTYGGAAVWYTLKAVPDNGTTYEAALTRWGNDYHIYSLRAIDALKATK
jgi:hypothetical protein